MTSYAPTLPIISENRLLLTGATANIRCWKVTGQTDSLVILFVLDEPRKMGEMTLPAGTVVFKYFWSDRPYNAYHWLATDGATVACTFNVSDQTKLSGRGVSWRDLIVDVVATPDGGTRIVGKDTLQPETDAELARYIQETYELLVDTGSALTKELEPLSSEYWSALFGKPRG